MYSFTFVTNNLPNPAVCHSILRVPLCGVTVTYQDRHPTKTLYPYKTSYKNNATLGYTHTFTFTQGWMCA